MVNKSELETAQEKQDDTKLIIAVFKKRKIIQWALAIPLVVFLIGYNIIERHGGSRVFGLPNEILLYPFMLYVMTAIFFSYINWRCPSCKRFVGWSINPKVCSRCGASLK